MENTQLYDFELTDEEMEQIEALEKMRSMTGTKPLDHLSEEGLSSADS